MLHRIADTAKSFGAMSYQSRIEVAKSDCVSLTFQGMRRLERQQVTALAQRGAEVQRCATLALLESSEERNER